MLKIKENALFVADSHFPHHGDDLLVLLQKIENGDIQTPQLFLMGDNFDLLFGYNEYVQTFSEEVIVLLQRLSQTLEIYYFEGNHDFCLSALFPDIMVYSREAQPVFFTLNGKKVAMSHGDKYAAGFLYGLYCKIIRNKHTLIFLKLWEKHIIDDRMAKLSKKNICHHFEGFEKRVAQILSSYKECDLVIEGHFHQAKRFGKYISLPSQACQHQVAVAEEGKIVFKSL